MCYVYITWPRVAELAALGCIERPDVGPVLHCGFWIGISAGAPNNQPPLQELMPTDPDHPPYSTKTPEQP